MTRIRFAKRYDHFVGNGTQVFYAPGDTGEFDAGLARSLVYEGFAVPAPAPADAPAHLPAETRVDGPAETKPAAAKKKR